MINNMQLNKHKTKKPRATYQDVLDAPQHVVAEIIEGKLYTHRRPANPHTFAGSRLGATLMQPFDFGDGPGSWLIVNEPELHLGDDIVVPDIAGWRRVRMPVYPPGAYITLAPDWVCEVLSPSTRKLDLGQKKNIYAREGVAYHWFVDPDERSLEALVLRGRKWVQIDKLYDDASVSLPPFEEFSFNLGNLWLPHTIHKGVPNLPTQESTGETVGISK